ncbi:MAG: DUF4430 domain-containing protein [Ruminococcus sp.]|nr:DUF4430 domain-containing protein [Ruminococcus sp.]
MTKTLLRRAAVFFISIVTAVGGFALPTFAAFSDDDISQTVSGIYAYRTGGSDADELQKYADSVLCEGAGTDSEWYAMTLSQSHDTDLSGYAAALEKYVSENEVPSASTREKYALALAAAGSDSPYITEVLSNSIGEQGIMSYVFGLHILNNGFEADGVTKEGTAAEILALQLDDGGWAVMGEYADIDVTAMCLQALAPLYEENDDVRSACDSALALLGEKQQDSGGFKSMGAENSESSSQVICALSAFGIDCQEDDRFIKNGNSAIDALMQYRLESGAFCHIIGDEENETATVEALYALVSYQRMKNGNTPFYVFDSCNDELAAKPEQTAVKSDSKAEISSAADSGAKSSVGYKPIAVGAVILLGVIVSAVLIFTKKRSPKNFAFIGVICAALCAVIVFTDIKTEKAYYADSSKAEGKVIGTASVSIRCDTIAGQGGVIPDDGAILEKTEYDIREGETAYDLLLEAAKDNGIRLDTKGTKNVYVSGIAQIYEFDHGELSGWVYHINSESASVGSASYVLRDGDDIEWLYTCDIERDLK